MVLLIVLAVLPIAALFPLPMPALLLVVLLLPCILLAFDMELTGVAADAVLHPVKVTAARTAGINPWSHRLFITYLLKNALV